MKIIVDYFLFVGTSKKLAKQAAATAVLTKLYSLKPFVNSANVSSEEQELADYIGRYVIFDI